MSSAKTHSIAIPTELEAEMTPAVHRFVESLLQRIGELEARNEELQRQGKGKTSQNSSLPPSTKHPHAKPKSRKRKSKKKRGGHLFDQIPLED